MSGVCWRGGIQAAVAARAKPSHALGRGLDWILTVVKMSNGQKQDQRQDNNNDEHSLHVKSLLLLHSLPPLLLMLVLVLVVLLLQLVHRSVVIALFLVPFIGCLLLVFFALVLLLVLILAVLLLLLLLLVLVLILVRIAALCSSARSLEAAAWLGDGGRRRGDGAKWALPEKLRR